MPSAKIIQNYQLQDFLQGVMPVFNGDLPDLIAYIKTKKINLLEVRRIKVPRYQLSICTIYDYSQERLISKNENISDKAAVVPVTDEKLTIFINENGL